MGIAESIVSFLFLVVVLFGIFYFTGLIRYLFVKTTTFSQIFSFCLVVSLLVFNSVVNKKAFSLDFWDRIVFDIVLTMCLGMILIYFFIGSEILDNNTKTNEGIAYKIEKIYRFFGLSCIGILFAQKDWAAPVSNIFVRPVFNMFGGSIDLYNKLMASDLCSIIFLAFSMCVYYFVWHVVVSFVGLHNLSREFRRADILYFIVSLIFIVSIVLAVNGVVVFSFFLVMIAIYLFKSNLLKYLWHT